MCKAITENTPQHVAAEPPCYRYWSDTMPADPVLGVEEGAKLLLEAVETFTDPGVYEVLTDEGIRFFRVERRDADSLWLASAACPPLTVFAENEWFARAVLARASGYFVRVCCPLGAGPSQ